MIELQLICEDLTLENEHVTKSMVGSHITLLMRAKGLFTVHQEDAIGIFEIPEFLISPKIRDKEVNK